MRMEFNISRGIFVVLGVLAAVPAGSAISSNETAVNDTILLTVQNDPILIDQAVIQFNIWALLFSCCMISLLLSCLVRRSEDLTGGLAVFLSAFCLYGVPRLAWVSYDTGVTTILNNTTGEIMTSVVTTPIVIQIGNLPLAALITGIFCIAVINLIRILMGIVQMSTRIPDREEVERDEFETKYIQGEQEILQQNNTGFERRKL